MGLCFVNPDQTIRFPSPSCDCGKACIVAAGCSLLCLSRHHRCGQPRSPRRSCLSLGNGDTEVPRATQPSEASSSWRRNLAPVLSLAACRCLAACLWRESRTARRIQQRSTLCNLVGRMVSSVSSAQLKPPRLNTPAPAPALGVCFPPCRRGQRRPGHLNYRNEKDTRLSLGVLFGPAPCSTCSHLTLYHTWAQKNGCKAAVLYVGTKKGQRYLAHGPFAYLPAPPLIITDLVADSVPRAAV